MIAIDYIYIELTNRCNFTCSFCPIRKMRRPLGDMPTAEVRRLIDEIVDRRFEYKDITFAIMGEPTLHSDWLHVLQYAQERGMTVNLNTNGSIITSQQFTRL
ncbi:unnamed protein product, partial [marine sediment metagenome]